MPIFTLHFPCVTLTKRSNLVWDSGGAVWTPYDAHVGCEKLQITQKMAKFKLEKMTPWGLFICSVTLTKLSVYFKISFSTVKQLPVSQIGGEMQEKASKNLDYFVNFSKSHSRSIKTHWNEWHTETTLLSTQAIDFRDQSWSSEENLKNWQKIIFSSFLKCLLKTFVKINFPL